MVSPDGGASTLLDDGPTAAAEYDNSWPRFSPDKGTFRGKTLYWVAFSSRRPYGVQLNTGVGTTHQPQLWFAGVTRGGDQRRLIPASPRSGCPGRTRSRWLPTGNHVPQWVKVAIVIN